MKQISAKVPRTIVRGSVIDVCDNSGAKKVFLISVKGLKTTKGRYPQGIRGKNPDIAKFAARML